MNYSMIFFIIGWVFIIEAALMAPSALVAVLYSERSIWAFAAAIGSACFWVCLWCGSSRPIRCFMQRKAA